jgi:DNA repair protein RAD50
MTERERMNNALRSYEGDIHAMQMQENTLNNQLRDMTTLEERIATMKKEIVTFTARVKVCVVHINSRRVLMSGSGIGRQNRRCSSTHRPS